MSLSSVIPLLIFLVILGIGVMLIRKFLSRKISAGSVAYIKGAAGEKTLWASDVEGRSLPYGGLGAQLAWRHYTDLLFADDPTYKSGSYFTKYEPLTVHFEGYQSARVHLVVKVELQLHGQPHRGEWELDKNVQLIRIMTSFKNQPEFYQSYLYPLIRQNAEVCSRHYHLNDLFLTTEALSDYAQTMKKRLIQEVSQIHTSEKQPDPQEILKILDVVLLDVEPEVAARDRLQELSAIDHHTRLHLAAKAEIEAGVAELEIKRASLKQEIFALKAEVESLQKKLQITQEKKDDAGNKGSSSTQTTRRATIHPERTR